jgi:hypothetical protein
MPQSTRPSTGDQAAVHGIALGSSSVEAVVIHLERAAIARARLEFDVYRHLPRTALARPCDWLSAGMAGLVLAWLVHRERRTVGRQTTVVVTAT